MKCHKEIPLEQAFPTSVALDKILPQPWKIVRSSGHTIKKKDSKVYDVKVYDVMVCAVPANDPRSCEELERLLYETLKFEDEVHDLFELRESTGKMAGATPTGKSIPSPTKPDTCIVAKHDLSTAQERYVDRLIDLPEHTNDRGLRDAWKNGQEGLYVLLLGKGDKLPIGIAEASGPKDALSGGLWIDEKFRGEGYENDLVAAR